MDQEKNRDKGKTGGAGLRRAWDNAWFVVPVLLFFALGLCLTMLTPHGREIIALNDFRETPLNQIFRFVTHLGEAPAFVIAVFAALFLRYRFALLIAMAGLLTIPVTYYLKDVIGEDRPITYFEGHGMRDALVLVPGESLNTGQTSFPSGHTTAAFNLYTLLAVMLPFRRRRWALLCAATAILVAFSRIFLVQHFLGDVLAGAGLGLFLAWLVLRFDRLLPARWTGLDRSLLTGAF